MTENPNIEPDAVHGYFGLSYANYVTLPRTLLQSMPDEWQLRFVRCLEELDRAFAHVERPTYYDVTAAVEVSYGDLSDAGMRELGITRLGGDDDGDLPDLYYDRYGDEHEGWERTLVPLPGGDPVPHYNRGRTRIEPILKDIP